MFPIPFNFPFRKKDGSMTTISQAISEGGGSYTLPTASDTTKGGIKVGVGLSMVGEVLNNTNPTPSTPYVLPTASADTLGGVKVGSGLSIDENGVLSSSGGSSIHLYEHNIILSHEVATGGPYKVRVSFKLITNSNTPYTIESLINYLSGTFNANTKLMSAIILPSDLSPTNAPYGIGIYFSSGNIYLYGSGELVYTPNQVTIYDTVRTII